MQVCAIYLCNIELDAIQVLSHFVDCSETCRYSLCLGFRTYQCRAWEMFGHDYMPHNCKYELKKNLSRYKCQSSHPKSIVSSPPFQWRPAAAHSSPPRHRHTRSAPICSDMHCH